MSKAVIKKIFSSQLRINMISGSFMSIVNIAISVIAYPIYINFLGYEKYGVWLVLTTVLSFAALGDLGIGTAVMKLVAEKKGKGDFLSIQNCITTALALLFISGTIIFVILMLLRHPIVTIFKLNDENSQMVLWLFPYIGIICIYTFMTQVLQAALSGFGRMDMANYIRSFSQGIQVAVSGVFLSCGYGVKAMLIGSLVCCATIHLLTMLCIGRIARLRIFNISNLNYAHLRNLLRFGGTVFSGTLINMLLAPFNKLMLTRYAGVSVLPVYEIVDKASMSVRSLIEAGLRALLPEISNISSQTTREAESRVNSIYTSALKIIITFGTTLFGTLFFLSPFIFSIWFGENFAKTMPTAFRVMLVGTFMSLLSVPAYYTLMGTNQVTHCLASHVIQSIVNFITISFIVIFIHTLDVQQVVLAVATGMSLSSIYLLTTMRIKMKNSFTKK